MGLTGSRHVKVLGDCYDLNEGKEYTGNFGDGFFACISLIVFCVLASVNAITKFENGILIGLMVFFGFCMLYAFTIGPTVSNGCSQERTGKGYRVLHLTVIVMKNTRGT